MIAGDPEADRFELTLAVGPDDIDQLGHVHNVVYLRWVQEAATAHWRAAAAPADQAALVWVVVRHEIDDKRPAVSDDEVIAQTWVGTASRRAFERHTLLLRARDRKELARARTLWCPIDPHSGRPAEVSASVRRRFSVGIAPE